MNATRGDDRSAQGWFSTGGEAGTELKRPFGYAPVQSERCFAIIPNTTNAAEVMDLPRQAL